MILAILLAVAAAPPPLVVGVTLHPYYSWTANVVEGTGIEVRPLLPGEVDASEYQPRPEDIRKLADMDAIVINGVGHDDFILPMIAASGNRHIVILKPNDAVPLLREAHGPGLNSHTFISFTNAIAQTWFIAEKLSALRPQLANRLQANAAAYVRRLRAMKNAAAARLAQARIRRVVCVHDGYAYLMQEFGIAIAGVVEPAHGLIPSAAELGAMVDLIRREHIRVVFSEESFPEPLLRVLREEGGARVYLISHIAKGPYSAGEFEQQMEKNVQSMVRALLTDPEAR